MWQRLKHNPLVMLGAGLAMGLLVGVGMLIGALAATQRDSGMELEFPAHLLHATATDSTSSMAIATGPIDEGVEGLFVLDFITGELQCLVMNPRTGTLGGMFKQNVHAALQVEQGKQPKYLMVTGQVSARTAVAGNVRPAESIVYVADANTGRFAAFALPWNRQAAQYNVTQAQAMQLIGGGSARNVVIE